MVADLVGEDVGLGEVALHLEAVLQLVIEAEIDVNFLVVRTIERPHRCHAGAAGGANRAGKQHELRVAVFLAVLAEDVVPDVLGVGEHHADELPEVVFAGALGMLERRPLRAGLGNVGGVRPGL